MGNDHATRKRADETQGFACATPSLEIRADALCVRVIGCAAESGRRKESLQRGQGFTFGLSSRRLAGGIVMNDSRLVTAEATYAGDAIYDGGCGDEVCITARSTATRRRRDRSSDRRIRKGEAAFLIRSGGYNWIHQVRLIASCQGTRQSTQRGERRRKSVAPG